MSMRLRLSNLAFAHGPFRRPCSPISDGLLVALTTDPTVSISSSPGGSLIAPFFARSFSLSVPTEKRGTGGCSKWKRGGLIQTTIYTGMKGKAPVPKPLFDYKSGDRNLGYDLPLPTAPQSKFVDLDLSSFDPKVRQILSAATGDNDDLIAYHQRTILDKVRRHPADEESLEVIIAKQTFNLKRLFSIIKTRKRYRKPLHSIIQTAVRRRYDDLMKLRQSDYDRFLWLCEILNIDFSLKPDVETELTEKEKIIETAHEEAERLKEDKIFEYKLFLERERRNFEELKRETIAKLEKDLAEFGYDPSFVEKSVQAGASSKLVESG